MFRNLSLISFALFSGFWSLYVVAGEEVLLTPSEKDYLIKHPVLNLCVDPDWLPYERIDEQGHHIGLVAEYMLLLQSRLNITFNVIKTNSWDDTQKLYRKGSCDIVSALNKTPERGQYLAFTDAYIKSPAVLVVNENNTEHKQLSDLNGKTLGMVKGYVYDSKLRQLYPDIKVVYLINMEEALKKVSNGDIDATLGPLFLLFALTQELALDNLKILGNAEFQDELRIGIKKDNVILTDIFTKAVSSLTNEDYTAIRKIWARKRKQ